MHCEYDFNSVPRDNINKSEFWRARGIIDTRCNRVCAAALHAWQTAALESSYSSVDFADLNPF
jgi:hypothetical protein